MYFNDWYISNSYNFNLFVGVKIQNETELRQFALLEFIPSNPPGAFRLRGMVSNLYLAMDKKGNLYGEEDYEDDTTLFVEHADVRFEKRAIGFISVNVKFVILVSLVLA